MNDLLLFNIPILNCFIVSISLNNKITKFTPKHLDKEVIAEGYQFFENVYISKDQIINLFKNKTGIYLWHNKITGEEYVGSGLDLSQILSRYFYTSYLFKPRRITRSILKYGHSNFSLVILEICGDTSTFRIPKNKTTYLSREQFYIDLYKPSLNINPTAGFSLNFLHTQETKDLIRNSRLGTLLSNKTKKILSQKLSGSLNPFWSKTHSIETKKLISKNLKKF